MVLVTLFALATLAAGALADTPANCFLNTTVAVWSLQVYPPSSDPLDDCSAPVGTPTELVVNLTEPDLAIDVSTGAQGFWTLVYDQGFELRINGRNFFAFFDWTTYPNGTVVSHCSRTKFGWYHDETDTAPPQVLGCYSARLQGASKYHERVYTVPEAARMPAGKPSIQMRSIRPRPPPLDRPAPSHRLMHKYGAASVAKSANLKESDFPPSFSWADANDGKSYLGPIRDQLNCGSCYAFASTNTLNAMVRIRKGVPAGSPSEIISPQDVVSCSFYSQGCDGGFPYLIGRWAHDHGIAQDPVFPYQSGIGSTIPCSLKRTDLPTDKKLFVSSYEYVGGYFGACTSAGMMEALLKHGPLAVSYEVYPDFGRFNFSGGAVYRHDYGDESVNPGGDDRFRVTNHVVMIVGYGVADDGTPYWSVANSWGHAFGENGIFRIARTPAGQTPTRPGGECAIEEMAVILTPQMDN